MGSFLEARGRFRRIAHRVGSDACARVPGFLWDSDTPRAAGTVFERAICHRGNDYFPLIRSRACWSTYLCRLDAAASGRHSVSESLARVLGASGFSPHANPLFRVWAAMPTCGIGGPRAGCRTRTRTSRPACMLRVPPLELRRLGCVARLLWRPDSVQDGSARRRETKRSCGTHPTDESRSLIRSRIRGHTGSLTEAWNRRQALAC